MALAPGTRLGPYVIAAPIGAGGMGEVFLAHDPRLNRRVLYDYDPQLRRQRRWPEILDGEGRIRFPPVESRTELVGRAEAPRADEVMGKPVFIPTKGKRARTIEIGSETVELLKAHKRHQAALKLRHRQEYHDHGLVFTREWDDGGRKYGTLGYPLGINTLGQREFARLIAAAKVKTITLHGLRHTCASLLLAAGVPPNVVQQRLGHRRIEITLEVYAHGPSRAAARCGAAPECAPLRRVIESVNNRSTTGRQKDEKARNFAGRLSLVRKGGLVPEGRAR
jgi:integrase-like protein